jgi:hydrogenase maturation protein HypF
MPGGAAAIRQPWRMAFAWLADAFGEPRPPSPGLERIVERRSWEAMAQIGASAGVSPLTSSMGRLFDAVGALCGLAPAASYEGQAAVELEAAAWSAPSAGEYRIELRQSPDGVELDPREAIRAIARDLQRGVDPHTVSASFHAGVATATVSALVGLAGDRDLGTAVLSGGVFQNRLLLETVAGGLERAGLRVLIPERLPPNDGGISYGQAAVAAARGGA